MAEWILELSVAEFERGEAARTPDIALRCTFVAIRIAADEPILHE